MRHSAKLREIEQGSARATAEDRAVAYLAKFPRRIVALATALTVELTLAIRWEREQAEMIRRHDPREVVCITPKDMRDIQASLARIPSGVASDSSAGRYILALVAEFPPDRAWWIARKVVEHQAVKVEMERFRQEHPNGLSGPMEIPESVKRAAARANSLYGPKPDAKT